MAHGAGAPWKALLQKSIALNSSLPYSKYMQLATVRPDGRPANRTVVFRGFLHDADDLTFVTDQRSRKVSELAANPCGEICWYFPETREQYRISGALTVVGAAAATPDSSQQQQQQQPGTPTPDPDGPQQQQQQQQCATSASLQGARQAAWDRMSAAGRAQFSWPAPRQPRLPADKALFLAPPREEASAAAAAAAAAAGGLSTPRPPDAFCLVVLAVEEVDLVDLRANARTIFTRRRQEACAETAQQQAGGAAWAAAAVNP